MYILSFSRPCNCHDVTFEMCKVYFCEVTLKQCQMFDQIMKPNDIFFFFFFLTALLAFYSDTIVVNEKLHVHKCEGEK